jgi:hypothetical protein
LSYSKRIWSNFEVWDRFYEIEDKTIANSISQIKLDCLKDETIRRAATTYRDGMADLLSRAEEAVDEDLSPYDLRSMLVREYEGHESVVEVVDTVAVG